MGFAPVFFLALGSIYPELSLLNIYEYDAVIDEKIHSLVWNDNFM